MRSPKKWCSIDEQVQILHNRGMQLDCHMAKNQLRRIGYYRLSAYWYPFRETSNENTFLSGTRFADVVALYEFDCKLRRLTFEALEQIEIAARFEIAYRLGEVDPTAYCMRENFNAQFAFDNRMARFNKTHARSNEVFIKHHNENYTKMPIWVACELWDFGMLSQFYQGMQKADKNAIAKRFDLQDGKHLETHLRVFNLIRNICAHCNAH